MTAIHFKIVTPEGIVLEEEVYQVTLPVLGGEVTLLPEHIPYIGALQSGEITFRKTLGGEETSLATSGGFVELHEDALVILADTAERAEDIDIARAEAGRARALELSKERVSMSEEEYARTAAALEKEMSRIKVARKHRTLHGISLEN